MRDYTVRVELDQMVTASRQRELTELLAGYQATIRVTTDGRSEIQLLTSGHDVWQSALTAMVALTKAGCAPIAMHIAQIDEQEQSQGTGSR